jgi:hypothetical protein
MEDTNKSLTQTNMQNGQTAKIPAGMTEDQYYRHKARKYHYKNQIKIKEMMGAGKPCPAGYEKYLKPFEG